MKYRSLLFLLLIVLLVGGCGGTIANPAPAPSDPPHAAAGQAISNGRQQICSSAGGFAIGGCLDAQFQTSGSGLRFNSRQAAAQWCLLGTTGYPADHQLAIMPSTGGCAAATLCLQVPSSCGGQAVLGSCGPGANLGAVTQIVGGGCYLGGSNTSGGQTVSWQTSGTESSSNHVMWVFEGFDAYALNGVSCTAGSTCAPTYSGGSLVASSVTVGSPSASQTFQFVYASSSTGDEIVYNSNTSAYLCDQGAGAAPTFGTCSSGNLWLPEHLSSTGTQWSFASLENTSVSRTLRINGNLNGYIDDPPYTHNILYNQNEVYYCDPHGAGGC